MELPCGKGSLVMAPSDINSIICFDEIVPGLAESMPPAMCSLTRTIWFWET